MSSNAGHRSYDENLLASAPAATKAQLQSGYNPDLLVEKVTPPPSRPDPEVGRHTPVEQADHEPMPPKVPFYRTRKGIIIIAVVVIVVIIAAAVGGAVGAKNGNKKQTAIAQTGTNPSSTITESAASSTPTGGSQGGVSADPSSHGTTTTAPAQSVGPGTNPTGAPITPPITRTSSINGQETAQAGR